MAKYKYRIIDDCVCTDEAAPYIFVILREAGHVANSIYRGEDAKELLHRHGKRTQGEIHEAMPAISNPKGLSEHECKSDGVGADKPPRGEDIPRWKVGVDSQPRNGADGNTAQARQQIQAAARKHKLQVVHHYDSGTERHHWCLLKRPVVIDPRRIKRFHDIRKGLPTR